MPPKPNGVPLRSNGVPPKPQDQPNYSSNRPGFEEKKNLCFRCQKPGHRARDCKSNPVSLNAVAPATDATTPPKEYANTMATRVNGKAVTALLDTECHYLVVVHNKLVRDEDRTDEQVDVVYANGFKDTLLIAYVKLDCPYIQGR